MEFAAPPPRDVQVVAAAREFLHHPVDRHRREGNLQSDLEALLRAVGVGSLESHYTTGKGEADIFLPNRRTFFELKAYPLGDPEKPRQGRTSESPRQQLDRYVAGEINRELGRIPADDREFNRDNWYGILTDGRSWHAYAYPHRHQSVGEIVGEPQLFLNEGESLARYLQSLLSARSFGREWIPSDPGTLFTELKDDLAALYRELPGSALGTTRTKQALWLDMMKTSGMVPEDVEGRQRLFIAHSFLIATVRLVSHTLFTADPQSDWMASFRGGFAGWALEFERGRKWARRLYQRVAGYDWRRREEDVFRSLYQHSVDAHDRKVFGEFYTPDWLAELMVGEILDDDWLEQSILAAATALKSPKPMQKIGVLDPTCGSGTFLYHAARRILSADGIVHFPPVQKSDIVCRLVNGMDIHPVAVELSRVNLERMLPAPPSMGSQSFRIYLGDSLQTGAKGQKSLLFGESRERMRIQTPGGRHFSLPMGFVRSSTFASDLQGMVKSAEDGKSLPDYLMHSLEGDEVRQLKGCYSDLVDIIAEEGNSVWTWYAVNVAAPHLLAERKVDRIVANPPWVKLADIQVRDRKTAMEEYGDSLDLRQPGRQAPHTDIASYFIIAVRSLYLSDPKHDPACWLVKKSAIASGQWERFRKKHRGTLRQSVDLEQLQPFGGGDATRSCLLMEHRCLRHADSSGLARLEAVTLEGNDRPGPTESLESARRKFRLVAVPDPLPQAPSAYLDSGIRQGATLVPHVLSLVEEAERFTGGGQVQVTTRRSAKPPWNRVRPQTGLVPGHWICPILTSSQMIAFIPSIRETRGIIPTDDRGQLLGNPGKACSFWSELDEIYGHHAGKGRSTPKTLLTQFDFQSKLSSQLNANRTLPWTVLHPSSGDVMRGSRIGTGQGIADSTLFWLTVGSREEAGYLVALLNSASLKDAFRQSRDSGRHFQLHPWRKVPIPPYDARNAEHRRLAELCSLAEEMALQVASERLAEKPDTGQVGLSGAIRESLRLDPVGRETEEIVRRLMPGQAA